MSCVRFMAGFGCRVRVKVRVRHSVRLRFGPRVRVEVKAAYSNGAWAMVNVISGLGLELGLG